jgi:hypothetical protein
MANTLASLKDFLEERRLIRKNDCLPLAQIRQRLVESQLLQTMRDICDAINTEAGTIIVDEQHYLPPEPVLSGFGFTRGQTEYVMRLELWGPRPSLVFVTRKWRDASPNRLFRWFYQFRRLEPLIVNFKFSCELLEEEVSEEELRQCFYYLLSGCSRSYTPSFRSVNGPRRSWGVNESGVRGES